MKKKIIFLIFFSFVFARADHFKIKNYTTEDGLSNNTVFALTRDNDGFIWLASGNGINRFDGYSFRSLSMPTVDTLSGFDFVFRWIVKQSIDSIPGHPGVLWLATFSGLIRVDLQTQQQTIYRNASDVPQSLADNIVRTLFVDSKNRLWVGTDGGLQRLSRDDKRFINISRKVVTCLTEDVTGNIWAGSDSARIFVIEKNRDEKVSLSCDLEFSRSGAVNCIYEDFYGNIWAGTELSGLWLLKTKGDQLSGRLNINFTKYQSGLHGENDVRSILGDSSGLWIASFGGGLSRILFNQKYTKGHADLQQSDFRLLSWTRKYDQKNSLVSNYLHHLYLDKQNILWVSSDDGLSKLNLRAKKFNFIINNINTRYSKSEVRIRSIFQDSFNRFWVGSINGGINNINIDKGYFFQSKMARELSQQLGERTVSAICEDMNRNLYFGTWGMGLFIKEYGKIGFTRLTSRDGDSTALPSDIIQGIIEDKSGNLWVGTFGGLALYHSQKKSFTTFNMGSQSRYPLPNNEIQSKAMFTDPFGNLWLGTYGGGLSVVNIDSAISLGPAKTNFYRFSTKGVSGKKISNDFIISISGYAKKDTFHLWIGSYAGGLNHLVFLSRDLAQINSQTKYLRDEVITEDEGLANNVVYGILNDDTGFLWLSTDNGITRIGTETGRIRNYRVSDGLPSNKYYWGAAYKNRDGLMFFGPQYGLLFFDPRQIKDIKSSPELRLTGFKVFDKYLDNDLRLRNSDELDLSYKQNSFAIQFSSLDMTNSALNSYKFRLIGFDQKLIKLTGSNQAIYRNVNPGDYVFELSGSNSDGYWCDTKTKLYIHIIPPFWQEIWFKITLFIFAFSMLGLFIFLRNRNITTHNLTLEEKNRQLIKQYQERKKAEQVLIENEKKYRYLIENSDDGIYLFFNKQFRLINSAFIKIFGYAEYEVLSSEFDFYSVISLEYRDEFKRWKLDLKNEKSKSPEFEFAAITKSGDLRYLEITLSYFPFEDGIAEQGIIRDITEKKNMEDQLFQLHKMEAVGRLAGGIAHDFNNLLTVIRGFTDLGLMKIKNSKPVDDIFSEIEVATSRAENLTRQLLAFSRKQILKPEIFNINNLLQEVEKMLDRILEENIHLKFSLDPSIANVKADRGKLTQVIMNLVINAKDAMPGGGDLVLQTKNVLLDEGFIKEYNQIQAGPFVQLSVSDTGVGMDSEVQKNIFEPFFTTKKTGKGTGLGLSLVYGVVNQSGGLVTVYSELGRGSTFKVYIPAILDGEQKINREKSILSDLPENISILLVEDDDKVREIVERSLDSKSVHIFKAANGAEGLEVFKNRKDEIDLIITDVIMPIMDGPQFVREVKKIKPSQKVLYMSGYTDNAVVQNGILDNDADFIQKPFRGVELKNLVAKMISK